MQVCVPAAQAQRGGLPCAAGYICPQHPVLFPLSAGTCSIKAGGPSVCAGFTQTSSQGWQQMKPEARIEPRAFSTLFFILIHVKLWLQKEMLFRDTQHTTYILMQEPRLQCLLTTHNLKGNSSASHVSSLQDQEVWHCACASVGFQLINARAIHQKCSKV